MTSGDLTPLQERALAFIEEHPYCSAMDIERALDLGRGGFRWGMEGLIRRGLVQRFESETIGVGGLRIVYSYARLGTNR